MSEVFEFLSANSGALAVIFSAVVTAATVFYAVLTSRLVAETRRMRSAQTDARVAVGMRPRDDAINLVELTVRNEGMGPAFALSFDVRTIDGRESNESVHNAIRELGFMRTPLPYLAAGGEIRTFLTSMIEEYDSKIESAFEIGVTYRTAAGERRMEKYVLDFSTLRGLKQIGQPPLSEMARSLAQIERQVKKFSTGVGRLHVLTESATERRGELMATSLMTKIARLKEDDVAEIEALVDGKLRDRS